MDASGETSDLEADRSRRFEVVVLAVATVAALLPVIAVVATRSGRYYVPLGDEATIDLRVRDVFTSNTPLVGSYSRGFNHPGPLLYWLIAPFSRLFGGAAWATQVGAAVLQGVAIATSGWLAFRRGGLLLALGVLAALGLAYSSFALGLQFLQPWNPNVAFPFFMLFLLLVWSAAIGSRWSIVGALVVGTFLIQLHVGYFGVVVIPAAWGALVIVRDTSLARAQPPDAKQPHWPAVLTASAGALMVLWAAPVVQQISGDPGNISALISHFRESNGSVGLVTALGVYAAEFRVPPPWLGGSDRLERFTDRVIPESMAWLLVLVVILGIGFLAAHRAQRRSAQRMVQLGAVTAVSSILAISRVDVELQHFLFSWRVISAVFVVLAAVWAVSCWVQLEQRPIPRRITVVALLVVIVAFSGIRTRDDVLQHRDHIGPRDEFARELFSQIQPRELPGGPILVRGVGTTSQGFTQGLVDELDRDGVPVRVDTPFGYQYGDLRTATVSNVDEVWYITPYGRYRPALDDLSGARVVAEVSALSPAQEHEMRALQRSVAEQLAAAGRSDLEQYLDTSLFSYIVKRSDVDGVSMQDVKRISALNARVEATGGCRCVIAAVPAGAVQNLPFSAGF